MSGGYSLKAILEIEKKNARIAKLEEKVKELSRDGTLNRVEDQLKEFAACIMDFSNTILPTKEHYGLFRYHPILKNHYETIKKAEEIMEEKQ